MLIVEDKYKVSPAGQLILTDTVLTEMGIKAGDDVTVAFLSKDGIKNDFAEFLITPFFENADDANQVFIPHELLNAAKIDVGADVNIACVDGAIIIYGSEGYDIESLDAILSSLEQSTQYLMDRAFEIPNTSSDSEQRSDSDGQNE